MSQTTNQNRQVTKDKIQMPKAMMQAMKQRKARDMRAVMAITTCITSSPILTRLEEEEHHQEDEEEEDEEEEEEEQ
ncbi:hypothetical protein ACOMHN_021685 [Nucella lapillus]